MPHENSGGGGDDLASTDEVKVYKDEGEEEKRASENLSEDKLGLVIETEEGKNSDIEDRHFLRDRKSSEGQTHRTSSAVDNPFAGRLPFGYPFLPPYPYAGAASLGLGGVPVPTGGFPFYMYGNDWFSQPPPAHMGLGHWPLGTHSSGLPTTPSVYGLPPAQTPPPLYGIHPPQTPPLYGITHPHRQFAHHFYSSEFPAVPWAGASGYPMPFGSPYSPYQLSRFSPGAMLPPHPNIPCAGVSHPKLVTTCQSQDISPPTSSTFTIKQRHLSFLGCSSSDSQGSSADRASLPGAKSPAMSKVPHIKKPLNAFMLFMKEMRQKVIDECTLKESAAINQILGRKWHSLDRAEQAKYYEMAKKKKVPTATLR